MGKGSIDFTMNLIICMLDIFACILSFADRFQNIFCFKLPAVFQIKAENFVGLDLDLICL